MYLIKEIFTERSKKESLAGFLGRKYKKLSREEMLKNLRDKNDRL